MKIKYNKNNGTYTIYPNKKSFKILQLTDIHLGGSIISKEDDKLALKTVTELINYAKPDFIIITGDLAISTTFLTKLNINKKIITKFANLLKEFNIPWAYTYGNHDTDFYSKKDIQKLDYLYKSLSYINGGMLLYPYTKPLITGRCNQIIEIRNNDESLNKVLYLIDSNSYLNRKLWEYDYIHDDQVAWYESTLKEYQKENSQIESMIFTHIPLREYLTALELYENQNNDVEYFFGENNEHIFGRVCCSNHPSNLFDTCKKLGSTKWIFCGHDHYNNMSLEYQGIRLTYGMSIDYHTMPNIRKHIDQRGATLITIENNVDIKQIPYKIIKENK